MNKPTLFNLKGNALGLCLESKMKKRVKEIQNMTHRIINNTIVIKS
jgi:hypothetical protein